MLFIIGAARLKPTVCGEEAPKEGALSIKWSADNGRCTCASETFFALLLKKLWLTISMSSRLHLILWSSLWNCVDRYEIRYEN